MKQMFCIECEHTFPGVENDSCPECQGEHTEELPPDWDDNTDGHFEGDFPSSPYTKYEPEYE